MNILDLLTGQQPQSGVLRFLGLPGGDQSAPQSADPTRSNPVLENPTFANTLTRLGFNMMADAAKPGATVLGSLGSAGATTIDQMDKIAASQQDNALKQAQAQYYLAKGMGGLNGMPMSEGFEGDAARARIILGDATSTPQQKARAQAVLDTFGALTQTINPKTGDVQALQKHVIPGLNTSADWSVPTPAGQPASPASAPIPATGDPTQSMLLPPPVFNKSGAAPTADNTTAVNVARATKAAETAGDRENQMRKQAESAAQDIADAKRIRSILDSGYKSGVSASARNAYETIKDTLGTATPQDETDMANYRFIKQVAGENVLANAKTLGANPSDFDARRIESLQGQAGDQPAQLRLVAAMKEASALGKQQQVDAIDTWKTKVGGIDQTDKTGALTGKPGTSFENWYQQLRNANPILTDDFLSSRGVPIPTSSQRKVLKFNPATGKLE